MSNAQLSIAVPRLLFNREVSCSMAGWMLFLFCSSLYCLVYNQVVLVSPASMMNSFLWSLQKYSVWLLLTPALFYGLRQIHNKAKSSFLLNYSLLGSSVLLSALLLQMLIDTTSYDLHGTTAKLVDTFPSQLSILCLLIALWHLFFRASSSRAETIAVTPDRANDSVKVMKGNGETVVLWSSVDVISAAGNYMELNCGPEKYLLRMTLKELEQQLPERQFIRVHRSHMVNIAAIHRIGSQQGSAFVELRNNLILPLSKTYKPAVEDTFFAPHLSQRNI
jgi:two-component system LytT family response regulator